MEPIISIEDQAQMAIKKSAGNPIVLLGLPLGIPQHADQSDNVISNCTVCDTEITSTVVKQRVLELAKISNISADILCMHCLLKVMEGTLKQGKRPRIEVMGNMNSMN